MQSTNYILVMGVCGSGKSTVAMKLVKHMDAQFIEADDLHPAANIAKMSQGLALSDADRMPWFDRIIEVAQQSRAACVVIACSALKRSYREYLREALPDLICVSLEGDQQLLTERMHGRTGHFMPPSLLQSQLSTLELPFGEPRTLHYSVARSADQIADAALTEIPRLLATLASTAPVVASEKQGITENDKSYGETK